MSNIPDGWQLVPKEPDEKIRAAMNQARFDTISGSLSIGIYKAALAAAPQPPAMPTTLPALEVARAIAAERMLWKKRYVHEASPIAIDCATAVHSVSNAIAALLPPSERAEFERVASGE